MTKESQNIEFKESWRDEYLNTDGGWLIFGVTPKLGKSQNIEFAHLKTVWKRD